MFTVIKVTAEYISMRFIRTTANEHVLTAFVDILRAVIINKYLPAITVESIQLSAFPPQPSFNYKAATVLNSTALYEKVESVAWLLTSFYMYLLFLGKVCCFYTLVITTEAVS